jgi:hypothetical protein
VQGDFFLRKEPQREETKVQRWALHTPPVITAQTLLYPYSHDNGIRATRIPERMIIAQYFHVFTDNYPYHGPIVSPGTARQLK